MSAIDISNVLVKENDNIKMYVVGYKYEGESIIFDIANGKFIGVIDCYRRPNQFITKEILEYLNIRRLDFLCWTHIDWDHTKGLSGLSKFIKSDTTIILPEGLSPREVDNLVDDNEKRNTYKKEYYNIFKMFERVDDNHRLKVNHGTNIYEFSLICAEKKKEYRVRIDSFAPISGVINKCEYDMVKDLYENVNFNEKLKNKFIQDKWYVESARRNNLYSVGLKIDISDINSKVSICLCGDLDNVTIETMQPSTRDRIFAENTILKIPHHGSENADLLFELDCIKRFGYGVTTCFKDKLPVKKMLDKYNEKCNSLYRTDLKKGDYGVVEFIIPLKDLKPLEPLYKNSAGKYVG